MEKRKLFRSETERMIGGVCGGIAEYLDLDPTVVRLVFVGLTFLGAQGILLYLILMLLMPTESRVMSQNVFPAEETRSTTPQ